MDTITSVAKMVYHSSVQVSGEPNDNVIVSRKYVTEDLLGIEPWSKDGKDGQGYAKGAWVQYNGKLYRCVEDYPDNPPGEDEKWEQASLEDKLGGGAGGLKKTRGYVLVGEEHDAEKYEVTINHNLDSKSLMVQVYEKDTNGELTPVDKSTVPYTIVDANNIQITFNEEPTTNYHLVIMAFD